MYRHKKRRPIHPTGLPFIKICLKAYLFNLCAYYSILLNNCQAFFTNKIYVNLYKLIVVYIKEDSFVYIITKESYKTISSQC